MKKTMKKMTAGVTMAAVLGLSAMPALGADVASKDLHLVVNGQTVTTNEDIGQPFITSAGRTMIPLRLVSEEFGYKTDWQQNGTIHITGDDGKVDVLLAIGADNYRANGKPGTFSEKPSLLNDRAYLPARDFMELYGVVTWDNATRTVTITTGQQPEPEQSDWTYSLGFGGDIQTVTKMYVQANNEKTGKVIYLTGAEKIYGDWVTDATHYADYIMGKTKTINGQDIVSVGRNGLMGNNEVTLFQVPDLDKVEGNTAELSYVHSVNATTDYTISNGYLYFTQGTAGPFVNNPHALYFTKAGDHDSEVTFELDFPVNACTLTVEDGTLVATEKDGTRHEILQVPEKDSVDVAHMQKVLEENDNKSLTSSEKACMPGASVSEEGADK